MNPKTREHLLHTLYDSVERDMKVAEPYKNIDDALACFERWCHLFEHSSEPLRLYGSPGAYKAKVGRIAVIAETAPQAISHALLWHLTTDEEFAELRSEEVAYFIHGRRL